MQAVSIHIVDIANGRVASGMSVEIWRIEGEAESHVVTGAVGNNGVVSGIAERETLFGIGTYELRMHVGEYFRALGTQLPDPAFIELALFRFALADLSQHYHLPVKLTAWGISCFRGGA